MSALRVMTDDFIRGTQLLRAGRFDEALSAFRIVYGDARAVGNTDLMAAALCEMAWSCYRIGDAEQGLECAMGARTLWKRLGNRLELARALAVAAMLCLDLGLADEAADRADQALELATAEDNEAMLAFALNARGIVLAVCHEAERGMHLVEQAVAIANQQANLAASAYYLLNLGVCHARLAKEADTRGELARVFDERAAAIEFTAAAIQHAQRGGDFWTLRAALGNNAEMLAQQGSCDAALVLLDQCADLLDEPAIGLRIQYLYTLGDVLFRAGRLDEARHNAAEAVALADSSSLIDQQISTTAKLAEILEALGDAPAALTQFKRYHALYLQRLTATAQRRARLGAIRAETDFWRRQADTDGSLAMPQRRRA